MISGVKVELHDVGHTRPSDMDVVLLGPNDVTVMLMSDHGGEADATGVDLAFNDAARRACRWAPP